MINGVNSLTDRLTGRIAQESSRKMNVRSATRSPASPTRPVSGRFDRSAQLVARASRAWSPRGRAGLTLYRVDPLGDVIDLSRAHGALLCNVHAAAPWGLDVP